jgi:hypothetical protein
VRSDDDLTFIRERWALWNWRSGRLDAHVVTADMHGAAFYDLATVFGRAGPGHRTHAV